jgi:hypothetical protein
MQSLPRNASPDLAMLTNISCTLLSTWRSILQFNSNWRRLHFSRATGRTLAEEEEPQLVSDIISRFLEKPLDYSDEDFPVDALAVYNRVAIWPKA